MDILREAVQAVQRNLNALARYLAITVGAGVALLAASHLLRARFGIEAGGAPDALPMALRVYQLGSIIGLAAVVAVAQATAFSRLGKEMDWPLWRIPGDREALARFFLPWFILNLSVFVMHSLAFRVLVLSQERLMGVLPLLMVLLFVLTAAASTMIGACVMFHGRLSWNELGESLSPLTREAGRSVIVFLFSIFQVLFILTIGMQVASTKWMLPLLDIISGYCDCVVFAGTWRLCMIDRDTLRDTEIDL